MSAFSLAAAATIALAPEFDPALPIELIDVLENARSELGDITELTASISAEGVRQPITVYREGDRLILWTGHRRVACSKSLGKTTISALICPKPSPAEFKIGQLVENMLREGMTEQDIYRTCKELESLGMARKDIAQKLGKSAGSASKYFAPDRCPPGGMEAFLESKLTLGQCYDIVTSNSPSDTQARFLKGATRKEAKTAASNGRSPRTVTVNIPLPVEAGKVNGMVSVTGVAGAPLDLDATEGLLKRALKAVKAAKSENLQVDTAEMLWADLAAPKPADTANN
jgi:ParB-like chromosome segregation protein Spo0J